MRFRSGICERQAATEEVSCRFEHCASERATVVRGTTYPVEVRLGGILTSTELVPHATLWAGQVHRGMQCVSHALPPADKPVPTCVPGQRQGIHPLVDCIMYQPFDFCFLVAPLPLRLVPRGEIPCPLSIRGALPVSSLVLGFSSPA